MSNKVTAIIQARTGSTRLPNKVLLPLGKEEKRVLEHVIERVQRSRKIDNVLIITTDKDEDKIIRAIGREYNCNVYPGSNNKPVLDNVLEACEEFGVETIVDVTADCPLIDTNQITDLVSTFNKSNFTYITNVLLRTWPRGFDLQVYSSLTLRIFSNMITDQQHRNHTGWNIMIRENIKNMCNMSYKKDLNEWRLCIDEKEDYILLKCIFDNFKNNKFTVYDVIDFLNKNYFLLKINKDVKQKTAGEG